MKKEWLLLSASTVLTLLLVLGLLRWLAPGLLGIPADLQLVQTDERVPPFFENVFRREDLNSQKFILKDPLTRVRAHPLLPRVGGLGPTDILGFRNTAVPNVADIVIIGDSQTYGNNAILEANWPSFVSQMLKDKQATVYNMSVGGWGGVQYLNMFSNATVFRPRTVVVAFYSGNDPMDSFMAAYSMESWGFLIPDHSLDAGDAPRVIFPAPEEEWWKVRFSDGVETIFTPTLRLASNREHPAVHAGYAIMADVAKRIVELAKPANVKVLFTIIPTKELAFAKKVEQEGLEAPEDYLYLVRSEERNIQGLREKVEGLDGAQYIDVVTPLQAAALTSAVLYPTNINGHPLAPGYAVIGRAVAESLTPLLAARPRGLVALVHSDGRYSLVLVTNEGVWSFASQEVIEANGWPLSDSIPGLTERDLAGISRLGVIDRVDQAHFGPEALH